jgi:hypothetical protein
LRTTEAGIVHVHSGDVLMPPFAQISRVTNPVIDADAVILKSNTADPLDPLPSFPDNPPAYLFLYPKNTHSPFAPTSELTSRITAR